MRKIVYVILAIFMVMGLFTGCGRTERLQAGEPFVYYLNMEGTGIEKRAFEWADDNPEAEIRNILGALNKTDESEKYRPAIPDSVEVQKFVLENEKLHIHFSKAYRKMKPEQEVLCRAAVVQSLVQIDGVELVKFYIEDEEIQNNEGMKIGYMSADEFVQNTGESLSSSQMSELTLYVPNKDGELLVKEIHDIRFNSNISVEKVVVEQLMKKKNIPNELVIMPPETKLLGVTVKDDICYVNFDEGFQITGYTINPELSIYSIVNSIIENGTASQVQISINGKTDVKFQNAVDLSNPLKKNEDFMEEEK